MPDIAEILTQNGIHYPGINDYKPLDKGLSLEDEIEMRGSFLQGLCMSGTIDSHRIEQLNKMNARIVSILVEKFINGESVIWDDEFEESENE